MFLAQLGIASASVAFVKVEDLGRAMHEEAGTSQLHCLYSEARVPRIGATLREGIAIPVP